jgi:hypothetical protein
MYLLHTNLSGFMQLFGSFLGFAYAAVRVKKKRWNYPCNRCWKPVHLRDIEAPEFRAILRLEERGQLKNPVTSGIENLTFRFVTMVPCCLSYICHSSQGKGVSFKSTRVLIFTVTILTSCKPVVFKHFVCILPCVHFLCTPKVVDVWFKLYRVRNLHLK